MSEAKPFVISKWEVWEAYKRVRANKGAAGVDEQSIADFERNLKGNLYKIWNRMSSGSYLPPPARTVKIPKANGGERKLGIPTVSDRIGQQVVKSRLEPAVGERINELTDRRQGCTPIPQLIARLNRQLKGWGNYFSLGYPSRAYRK